MQPVTSYLSPHLFWDVALDSVDFQKNKQLIVDRVLHRGTLQEWNFIIDYYGKDELIKILYDLPVIAPKEANFVKLIFNLDPTKMRCYTRKQLSQNY